MILAALLLALASPSDGDHPPEDSSSKLRNWQQQLGGANYLEALAATGMVPGGGSPAAGSSVWTRSGPHGGFGNTGDSGRVTAVQLLDVAGVTWVYIGASGGGVYRCQLATPGVWEELGANLPNPSVRGLNVLPANPKDIVVGTGDWMRYRGSGIYRTINAGATWTQASVPATDLEYVFRIERSITTATTLVAATDEGLLRSLDGGSSWAYAQRGGNDITELVGDLVRHPYQPGRMYAVARDVGVLESTDDGATWTVLTDPDFPAATNWGRGVMAISWGNPLVIAVAHEESGSLRGVYRTTDGGVDWEDVTPTLPANYNNQIFHAFCLAIRPIDPDEILLGTVGIARSYWDSGAGELKWWIGPPTTGIPEGHSDYVQLHFDLLSGTDSLWQASDGGLYRYDFGGALSSYQGTGATGLAISQIDQLDADRTMVTVGLQDNGVLRTTNAGTSWTLQKAQDGGDQRIVDPELFHYWFGHTSGSGWNIWRSLYNNAPELVPLPPSGLINALHYVPKQKKIWASDMKDIWSAPAFGTLPASGSSLWTRAVLPGGVHPNPNYLIGQISGSPLADETLYVFYRNHPDLTVIHKVNGAWDLNHVTGIATMPGTGWPVRRVTPSHQWPGECWVAMGGDPGDPKVGHVVNYGENQATDYEDLTANLASLRNVFAVVPKPFDPLTLYAGTDVGVFRSVDGGSSWQPFQDGMPICQVKDMVFVVDDTHTGNHVLRVATYGLGTWQRTIPAAPILYVDATSTSPTPDGTFEHPYATVDAAVNAAPQGAVVALRAASYAAPLIVSGKSVRLVTWAGRSYVQ